MSQATVQFWSNEARVEVAGHRLTPAQSATVRCALNAFIASCDAERAELGPIADAYIERAGEVLKLIHGDIR